MADLEFNKIAAAILATALGYLGIKEITHLAFHTEGPKIPAYALELPEVPAAGAEAAEPVPFPSPFWIESMDATKGAKVFKKCVSCHNADDGGANSTGPNLWNVVNAAAGSKAGFKYSSAMSSSGIVWDYETLDAYLTKPSKYLKGTAMNFIGLKKEQDRAAVIEYLRAQSANPVARPVAITVENEDQAEMMTEAGAVVEETVDGLVDTVTEAVTDAVAPDETPAAEGSEN